MPIPVNQSVPHRRHYFSVPQNRKFDADAIAFGIPAVARQPGMEIAGNTSVNFQDMGPAIHTDGSWMTCGPWGPWIEPRFTQLLVPLSQAPRESSACTR